MSASSCGSFLLVSLVKSTRQFSNKSKVGGDVDDIDDDWMSRELCPSFCFSFVYQIIFLKETKLQTRLIRVMNMHE